MPYADLPDFLESFREQHAEQDLDIDSESIPLDESGDHLGGAIETSNPLSYSEKIASGPNLIFGDSQSGGQIGRALKQRFGGTVVSKSSSIPSYWAKKGRLFKRIKKHLEKGPKNIYITLGGLPAGVRGTKSLLNTILEISPNSQIFWITPPPPAFDGYKYKHSDWHDGREKRTYQIEAIAESFEGVVMINSYEIVGSGYYCNKTCDGIHAPESVAKQIVGSIQ